MRNKENRISRDFLCSPDRDSVGAAVFCSRYHYRKEDLPAIKKVWEELYERLSICLSYELTPCSPEGGYSYARFLELSPGGKMKLWGRLTLGEEPERLEGSYLEEGRLGDAYLLECLSCYCLEKIYEKLPGILHGETGLWMNAMRFPEKTKMPVSLFAVEFESLMTLKRSGERPFSCRGCGSGNCPFGKVVL